MDDTNATFGVIILSIVITSGIIASCSFICYNKKTKENQPLLEKNKKAKKLLNITYNETSL